MLRAGVVVGAEAGRLTIEFQRPDACERCGRCDGGRHAHRVTLPGEARVGDRATVDMPEEVVVRASLLAYAAPLAFLMAGLLLSGALRPALAPALSADWFAALCALAGLLLSFAYLRLVDRFIRGKRNWTPQIISVEHVAD